MVLVARHELATSLVDAVREWFALRPRGARLQKRDLQGETEFRILPDCQAAAEVRILVMPSGKYELSAGRAIHFEDVVGTPPQLVRLLESIEEGKISERIWTIRDRVVRHEGEIDVPGEVWRTRGSSSLLEMLGFGHEAEIRYEPW